MSTLKKFVACVSGPRLFQFYKLQRNTLATEAPDVIPNRFESIPDTLIKASSEGFDPFKPTGKNESHFLENLAPPLKRSFNFAAYVNKVDTLQNLVKLGVSLFDIENCYPQKGKYLTTLDFERDCINHIRFLLKHGVKEKSLGRFITIYPDVFRESLENLQIRINYLESKKFSKSMISAMLNKNALILAQKTTILDEKLGQLQIEFGLDDKMVRTIIVKHPDVALLPRDQYRLVQVCLSQEFGFTDDETKILVTKNPLIIDIIRPHLIRKLDLVHNIFGLTHEQIVQFPKLISEPTIDMRNRCFYLKKLKRNQFNANFPLYVPPSALYEPDDEEFCAKYAKTTVDDYRMFLKAQ